MVIRFDFTHGNWLYHMKIIITLGVQSGDKYEESSRCTLEVSDYEEISTVLKEAKKSSAPLVANPILQANLEPYLYLMHPETLEKLDESKTVADYALKDQSVLRLMSAVR